MRFEIDWASLIVGSKFTVFALFYFVYLGSIFQVQAPGGLYLEGRFNGGFFALPVWGAYTWRGLFSEYYGIGLLIQTSKLKNKLVFQCHLSSERSNLPSNPFQSSRIFAASRY